MSAADIADDESEQSADALLVGGCFLRRYRSGKLSLFGYRNLR